MQNLTDIGYVKTILERHGFHFSKALGQNFLINPSVCPRIAEMGNAAEGFGVLEIGTGVGTLTAELAKRADKVVAVELDDRLFPILEETLADFDNVKVIHGDAMKYDLAGLIAEEFKGLRVAVCANLPYYITSPLIMRLLEEKLPIETITVMVQKEAAQRLCAPIGSRESGAVSVAVAFYGSAKTLFQVSRGSFMPAPNVDSAVIQITLHKEKPWQVADEAVFFRMVKVGFSQRRKQLSGVLAGGLGIPKARMQEIFAEAQIPSNARIESLTMEELVGLANVLAGEM
ncbi:MAG: 16S rRNA (adenine(1518)-N(6)/adenine(1519)-N(6))-dimethyltransferase RsmA [Oscillospiraceae bacterium]|nr:16S rRNA (adenine(1518)-N(6)/adenine(1519)-N(6))-dimethyltransferase RsmA [Oscillospiraceae bacterium]MBQ9111219.1 16S rRNA (adenine(1518)-N(6)/adenine(1519)-N(6))-dimethyltransferase RsmA [Oscillospiraceae bacterium]